jgi:hypothetical protein
MGVQDRLVLPYSSVVSTIIEFIFMKQTQVVHINHIMPEQLVAEEIL